jgi:hypothetical protein
MMVSLHAAAPPPPPPPPPPKISPLVPKSSPPHSA